MAITVAEALQAGRDKLGVKSGDPEFSPAKLLDALNDTLGELHQDLQGINADLLEVSATLTADSTESRVFSLASQAPPILNVFAPRQLTLTDADGVAFDRRDRVRLDQYGGRGYALMGLPGAQRIEQRVERQRLRSRAGSTVAATGLHVVAVHVPLHVGHVVVAQHGVELLLDRRRKPRGDAAELRQAVHRQHAEAAAEKARKVAIQVLEFLDRHGVTMRRGDVRRLNPHRAGLFDAADDRANCGKFVFGFKRRAHAPTPSVPWGSTLARAVLIQSRRSRRSSAFALNVA